MIIDGSTIVVTGGAGLWSAGLGAAAPIFNAGRTKANVRYAESVQRALVVRYQRAIHVALREVADALASYRKTADQRTEQQHLVETLEASNLLVVPLDRQRRWYRCHHLLRDLLRDELERSEPELIPRLHDRAAAWFEANERPALALEHAQAAGDADRAARLLIQVAQPTYGAGRVDTAARRAGVRHDGRYGSRGATSEVACIV